MNRLRTEVEKRRRSGRNDVYSPGVGVITQASKQGLRAERHEVSLVLRSVRERRSIRRTSETDERVDEGTGRLGGTRLHQTVRVCVSPTDSQNAPNIPFVHSDMGRSRSPRIHEILETSGDEEHETVANERSRGHGLRLGSKADHRRGDG